MKASLQSLSNSQFGVRFALWIGRTLPLSWSYRVADWIAAWFARRDNPMTRAVRANQWVVRGENATPAELDAAMRQVFRHAGHCFADLYSNLHNPEALKALTPYTPNVERLIRTASLETPGAFLVAPHMSAFDILLLALAYHGLRAKVLSYGNPTGGYELQNEIRRSAGLEIIPVSGENTHQEAIAHLRAGGVVITGVDRPIPGKSHRLRFFGRPSPLPAGHIRIAMAAKVPVLVAAAHWQSDQKYHLLLSDPIPMQAHADRGEAIRRNGEAVLKVIEGFIRRAPEQWLMYYPVWPEAVEELYGV